MQLLGEFHHDQAHIADHGQQHFAQRLRLPGFKSAFRRPIGHQPKMAQLGERAGEAHRLYADTFFGGFTLEVFAVEERRKCRSHHHIIIRFQGAHDLRHVDCGAANRLGGGRQVEFAQGCKPFIQPRTDRPGRCGGLHCRYHTRHVNPHT